VSLRYYPLPGTTEDVTPFLVFTYNMYRYAQNLKKTHSKLFTFIIARYGATVSANTYACGSNHTRNNRKQGTRVNSTPEKRARMREI